jgi:hypothetical protein
MASSKIPPNFIAIEILLPLFMSITFYGFKMLFSHFHFLFMTHNVCVKNTNFHIRLPQHITTTHQQQKMMNTLIMMVWIEWRREWINKIDDFDADLHPHSPLSRAINFERQRRETSWKNKIQFIFFGLSWILFRHI